MWLQGSVFNFKESMLSNNKILFVFFFGSQFLKRRNAIFKRKHGFLVDDASGLSRQAFGTSKTFGKETFLVEPKWRHLGPDRWVEHFNVEPGKKNLNLDIWIKYSFRWASKETFGTGRRFAENIFLVKTKSWEVVALCHSNKRIPNAIQWSQHGRLANVHILQGNVV